MKATLQEAGIKIKKDASQLLLIPDGKPEIYLGKNGRTKNYYISQKTSTMSQKKSLPNYVGEWDKKNKFLVRISFKLLIQIVLKKKYQKVNWGQSGWNMKTAHNTVFLSCGIFFSIFLCMTSKIISFFFLVDFFSVLAYNEHS